MDLVMRNKPSDHHRQLTSLTNNNNNRSRTNSLSPPSVDSNNNNNPSSGHSHGNNNKCRSLVCDSSGIIIAEMVYRCMICYYVTDSITEAKDHYSMAHMQEEEEDDEESDNNRSNNINNNHLINHHKSPAAAAAEAMMRFASGALGGRNMTSSNPLVSESLSLLEENASLPLKFGNTSHHLNNTLRQLTQQNNLLKRNNVNGLLAPLPALTGQAQLTNGSSGNSSSNTKSGYVNCAVCGVTRFYSCVQRRYGQFTCVTCYRYFRTFLLKPKKYACPNLGQCPLNVRTRCRACWIKGCISVFSVDSRRQQVLQANLPVKKLSGGSTSPSKIPGLMAGSSAASLAGMLSQIQHSMFAQNEDPEEDIDRDDVGISPRSGQEGLDDNGIDDDMEDEPPLDDDIDEKNSTEFEGSMLEPEVSLTENDGDDNDGDIDSSAADLSDNNNHSSSFNNSPQYSPVGKSGGVGLPQHQLNKLIVTGKKVWSCGKCMTCTAEDCGKCIYCLDRPKFGGPFIKKQRCIKRRCLMKIKNGNNKHLSNNNANTLLRK